LFNLLDDTGARRWRVEFLSGPTLLSVLKNSITCTWYGCLLLGAANANGAAPSNGGLSGYVNMPSARVEADGTFSMGYSYDQPYGTLWVSSTVFPFLQVSGRYVSVTGIQGFTDQPGQYGSNYGRYKDKVFDLKARLWEEGQYLPSVALGATDLQGTELFKGQFIAATKTFGAARNVEATIGYGRRRPNGLFAGARWTSLSAPSWSVVAEYDANEYSKDYRASETAAGKRESGPVVGVEYRWGWLGAQVARHRDHFSANVYASIPFSEKEFIPKVLEPAYYQPKTAPLRRTSAQWRDDPRLAAPMIAELAKQDFKNIRVALDGGALNVTLTNSRISQVGRAVGRASRVILAYAPTETRTIHITYTRLEQPLVSYEFRDLATLADYLAGRTPRSAFLNTVLVRPADKADALEADSASLLPDSDEHSSLGVYANKDGHLVQLSSEDREDNRFKITPKMGFFFNDPSGALRYEVAAAANYDRRLGTGLYLNSAFKLNLFEDISGVTQESNSLLPHVRTDIAEYKRGDRFKLNKAMLNQYWQPADGIYARVSGGFYEEMYRGFGGQVLYVPSDTRWAADLSVDALQQRGFEGWLGKRDYKTVTALGALHYRLPYDTTVTARAGRFLARDNGVRLEFKRRFRSGIEVGAWYTKTNGNDITSPGSPSSPYHDKGVFLSIPLFSMLPMDSQASAGFVLAPWTRDVGQMVATPGDLYEMVEQPRRDLHNYDGLGNFAERADEQRLPAVALPDRPAPNAWPAMRLRLEQSAAAAPSLPSWAYGTAMAGGAIALSTLLDKPVDKFAVKHQDSRLVRDYGQFGKYMPIALLGTVGAAVALGDERMQNMGIISLQSVAGALGVTAVGKYVVGRARPDEDRGPWAHVGADRSRSNASFPSAHSAIAFAAVTPFAQEYDAPWLYGVAAVSAMGRTANRQHWTSDVVAGGIVGYAMGTILWQAQRDNTRSKLTIAPGPKEINVAWQTSFR
jgi:membrane-associated phospholipid phosphatase